MWKASYVVLALVIGALSAASQTPVYTYRVIHTYPHDRSAFTQGLVFHDGYLYEGTGMEGRSVVRKVRLEIGEVVQEVRLDRQHFGEGMAIAGEKLIQLTWSSAVESRQDARAERARTRRRLGQ